MDKKFRGMTLYEVGQELWNLAGDMDINEAIASYGGVAEAVSAAVEVLSENEFDFDGVDAERALQVYLEAELGL